ncbi:MAG: hypothetical protein Ta2G_05410 [Termitinemataceae bacterium]|nr:MAG: hypothetical protein Ta2G_05410 [Termitinemataceae bacterium]
MKKIVLFILCLSLVISLYARGNGDDDSGAGKTKTSRVDSGKVIDLDGRWNETDIDIVCKDLVAQFLANPRVANFEARNKRLPVIRVSNFKNTSGEPIDTSIISKRLQVAILNSGMADFVADSSVSEALRAEADEQQMGRTSDKSAKSITKEIGADFLLTGKVAVVIQEAGKQQVRSYDVSADATSVETHMLIWSGQNTSIKKVITKKK